MFLIAVGSPLFNLKSLQLKTTIKMTELPTNKVAGGVNFHLLVKNNQFVIYKLTKDNSVWYEVAKYQVKNPDMFHDDDYEYFPFRNDEAFGVTAWCCSDLDCVQKVLNEHFDSYKNPIPCRNVRFKGGRVDQTQRFVE